MTDLEVLKGMRELLSDPNSHIKGAFFQDKEGNECTMRDAAKFCLWGAFMKVLNTENLVGKRMPRQLLEETDSPISFNDQHSHKQVVAALDRAIAKFK